MSALNGEKISIVHWFSDLETHQCGYCKNQTGSVSYGMWAERLNVEDYQNLIDRGWRRSGMYCYKPMMHLTCCPQYTIKCSVQDFKLSKSQKKVIKRFNKFVTNGTGQKDIGDASNVADDSTPHEPIMVREKPNVVFDYSKFVNSDIKMESIGDHSNPSCSSTVRIETSCARDDVEKTVVEKHSVGPDLCKAPCKKAKILRIERKQQKLRAKGITLEKAPPVNEAKTLEEFLNEIPATSKYKFKTKLVASADIENELDTIKMIEFQLYRKYQMAIHNDPPEKCTVASFTRFLISSPLERVRVRGNSSAVTFGSFHQQYWLDDELIAVAVLDILPRCVSSVYFFYDPDYRFLTLGTYGSLREVQFVQSLSKSVPALKFYYMGFYIHSCPKMRYKGKLNSSFLLCPETYQWFPIEKCTPKLEKEKYSRLNDDLDALDENLCTSRDIDSIKVWVSYSFTHFGNYKRKYGEEEVFENIGRLVGRKNASSLLFVSTKG
ncbi:hypothetical protein PPYR_06514 [Photinus pyralis]|uniref:Arginyl-tRNA--protein transferase 1 n=1 Tax=Photinus pyralis TaxID=7054 RepID=A0A5N4ATR9_PHOPY|nr:arginyl-tRNA--protein transferase 1 isoform X1 [Photinus pyralis]KAB0800775.1 hypothetical protein PPYR_06514 [Photinus pyralis]